jgi:hypothetical protein
LQLVFAQSILYHLAINLIKASIVLQYTRFFHLIRPLVYCCCVLFTIILGNTAWGVFGVVFLCRPVQGYWNLRIEGQCVVGEDHFVSTNIVGIVLDWAIWVLPLPAVAGLRIRWRERVRLLILFRVGGL